MITARRPPSLLPDQKRRFLRMVKHIHEHHDIVRSIGERQDATIELLNGDRRLRTRTNLHAHRGDLGTALGDRSRQGAVAAAHVQQRVAPSGIISPMLSASAWTRRPKISDCEERS